MLTQFVCFVAASASDPGPPFKAFLWPNEPPTDIPFEHSLLLTGVEFTGRYATYGAADTWYPTWGADGNLYTPWTDGTVHGVRSNSADDGEEPHHLTKTGFATVRGDDPFNLTIADVGTFESSPWPYHGRYPCGSLYYNKTWFYGTYMLDNENHEPGLGVSESGYCENWCIQGPFAGFRWSQDQGQSWHEPRLHVKGWDDNLFGEQAPDNHTYKVKFGAPHVVDLGQELEHRPAGDEEPMMYIVGHGTSQSYSPSSWMQGSEVYMARVAPTVEAVEDRARWEFFAGDGTWVRGDVSQARPLVAWANRTGVTTMTYIPALQRYIMCISTPTYSPYTEKQFDTYFLESESITGPFVYVTYMRRFGPESYFVNIPSKFVSSKLDANGSISMFLSYSANFALASDANPPGSGYHWTLQEVKFQLSEAAKHTIV